MNMFEDFKRQALPWIELIPENDWDLLALAQHRGMATRLSNWTLNPKAALWFTVEYPAKENKSAEVWIFEALAEDYANPKKNRNPFTIPRTLVFRPRHISRRIMVQSGWFTIHKLLPSKGMG